MSRMTWYMWEARGGYGALREGQGNFHYVCVCVSVCVRTGAVRELRRDAAFLAAHRDRERAMVDAERLENQKR